MASLAGLILLSPVFIIICALVKVSSLGPVYCGGNWWKKVDIQLQEQKCGSCCLRRAFFLHGEFTKRLANSR
jgi:hypothetical protein